VGEDNLKVIVVVPLRLHYLEEDRMSEGGIEKEEKEMEGDGSSNISDRSGTGEEEGRRGGGGGV